MFVIVEPEVLPVGSVPGCVTNPLVPRDVRCVFKNHCPAISSSRLTRIKRAWKVFSRFAFYGIERFVENIYTVDFRLFQSKNLLWIATDKDLNKQEIKKQI